MTKSDAYPRLLATLDEVRRQWRTHKVLEGALLTVGGVFAVLALLVAADNLFHPGSLGRVGLAAILWGGLVLAVLSLVVKRFMEDRRDDFFAALVERRHPDLRNTLINALQLGRDHTPGFSPSLIQAIIGDADKALRDRELTDVVDRGPTKKAGLFALLALLVVGGYAAAMTPWFVNGLTRVLLPIGDIDPYTRTRIPSGNVDPGDTKIPEGKKIEIRVTVEGVIPATARLHRRAASGTWQVNEMIADSKVEGLFTFVVPEASTSFDYYIRAGDAKSKTFRIDVVRPPQIEQLSLVYTYPAYTGLSPRRIDSSDGEVAALVGTTVTVEVKPTKPLRLAELHTQGDKTRPSVTLELEKLEDSQTRKTSFVVWPKGTKKNAEMAGKILIDAPTSYQVKMEDTEGYTSNENLWRAVRVVPDLPPEVALRAPDEQLSLNNKTRVPLMVDARDDFGMGVVRILYRVNNDEKIQTLVTFDHSAGKPEKSTRDKYTWDLSKSGLKLGDRVEYWAEVLDRNNITGPGKTESLHFYIDVIDPADALKKLDTRIADYLNDLKEILKLQRLNRTETADAKPFTGLSVRQGTIRKKTLGVANKIETDDLILASVPASLRNLAAGDMTLCITLFESGKDTDKKLLPAQDRIIKELEDLIERLERNQRARRKLKEMKEKKPEDYKTSQAVLNKLIKNLTELLKDQTQLAGKYQRLPKKTDEKVKEDLLKGLRADLDDLKRRSEKWGKGSVQELTKMPKGFVDDFDMRKDVNKIFEEVEKAKAGKAEKLDVSLEDLGAGLATKMKEDLEMWLPDAADSVKWRLEEPLNKKPMKIPEMPLPKKLQDLVGDLLQKADEFDEDADDVTSAWGDNLDQAGWGVSDGPISSFSAKGKTGNDMPNNMEVSGRSGDGRRGKSSGQMVGDTAKALPGRKTPARVTNEKYEPGKLKAEAQEDPNGSTGGGKKSGAGRRGLQGGSPPDMVKDIGRLSAKQAGMREKMEQVAQKLESQKVSSVRIREGIKLLKEADKDLKDGKYTDAARKRREAMQKLRAEYGDRSTATKISQAKELPASMRRDLLQSAEAGYPAGYEGLLKSYYKAISAGEK